MKFEVDKSAARILSPAAGSSPSRHRRLPAIWFNDIRPHHSGPIVSFALSL